MQLSNPPLLPFDDVFMKAHGSGDHIPFTTSGLVFHCITYTISPQNVNTWMFGANATQMKKVGSLQRAAVAFIHLTLVFRGIF